MSRIETIAEGVTLYLGDCREVLPALGRFGALITDPPYGIAHTWKGGKGHGWGKARAEGVVRNEWDASAPDKALLDALLASCDQHIIWGGNYFDLPLSRCWYVWNKPERGFTLAEAELAWTSRDSVVRVFDAPRSESSREHPTQKPLALMAWCVGKTVGSILDPYMGSGTTGAAAVRAGRPFTGVEAHEPYFDMACRRIAEAARQPDMLIQAEKRSAEIQVRFEDIWSDPYYKDAAE